VSAYSFRPDPLAIDRFLEGPEIEEILQEAVDAVAERARPMAPVGTTGEGAASIHGEVHRGAPASAFASTYAPENEEEPIGYVSWDQDHYYMLWAEEGSERQAPQPFLRPALDATEI
jgi:hypothetical protein